MAAYARQANVNDLIEKATEIRVRAQRKAGEMLAQAAEQGMRDPGGRSHAIESQRATQSMPTLAEIGITKSQSSRYQQLAAMPAEHFETAGRCAMLDSRNIAPHHPVASFLLGWLVDFAPNCLFLIEKLAEAVSPKRPFFAASLRLKNPVFIGEAEKR